MASITSYYQNKIQSTPSVSNGNTPITPTPKVAGNGITSYYKTATTQNKTVPIKTTPVQDFKAIKQTPNFQVVKGASFSSSPIAGLNNITSSPNIMPILKNTDSSTTIAGIYSDRTNKNLLKIREDKYQKLELESKSKNPRPEKTKQYQNEISEITNAINITGKDPMSSLKRELINDKYSRQRGVSNVLKIPTASFISSMFGAVTGIADINTEIEKKAREKIGDTAVNIINPIVGRSSTSLLVPAIKKIEKPFQGILDKYIEDESPTNPDFGDTLIQGAGSMAVFYTASVLTGGANNIPTALESLSEAGAVYTTNKKKGVKPTEAFKRATTTFVANMILNTVTNKYSGVFDAKKGAGQTNKQKIIDIISGASFEGVQEGTQQLISNITTKAEDVWEGVFESLGVGAIIGGGVKGLQASKVVEGKTQQGVAGLLEKGKTTTISTATKDTRPSHQALLEKAFNSGNKQEVNRILDSIPANDPYKKPMETLFRNKPITQNLSNTAIQKQVVTEKANDIKQAIPEMDVKTAKILRGTKGMTADDIMKTYPDIKLKKDVPATDVYGNKVKIPDGEVLTPYEVKGNKVLLQDGETYIVSNSQYQNIKGQSVSKEVKKFAPELDNLEETVKELPADRRERLDTAFKEGKMTDKEYLAEKGKMNVDTKYSQYQLPNGKNYREVLIKSPLTSKKPLTKEEFLEMNSEEYLYANYEEYLNEFKKGNEDATTNTFRSSHWEEPNVISHLRINERTYEGKKVAFMEELQSDWAREGRDKGFISKAYKKEDVKYIGEDKFFWRYKVPNNELQISKSDYPTRELAMQRVLDKTTGDVPPNALLKNWQELTIKRALQEAVANGSEYFAWINGEQTSARYNLSTQIDNVTWVKNKPFEGENLPDKTIILRPKTGDKNITISLEKDGTIKSSSQADWKDKKLDEVIGKGLADKIMEKDNGELSGEGLKFGGEWATNLYDKQVRNIVQDLTDGKVEIIDMGLPIEKSTKEWRIVETGKPPYTFKTLDASKLEIGLEIHSSEGDGVSYIITNILGDGKFNAVAKNQTKEIIKDDYGRIAEGFTKKIEGTNLAYKPSNTNAETFDISIKKSAGQQAVKLTPEIVAKIKGEAPTFKASGKQFEDSITPTQIESSTSQAMVKSTEDLTQELKNTYAKVGEPVEQALSEIYTELEMSEAGTRHFTEDGVIGQKSSFPDWIPEEYRQKVLFDKVLGGLKQVSDIKYPDKNSPRLRAFYDVLLDEVDSRAGINTSKLRSDIMNNNEARKVEQPKILNDRSTERSEKSVKQQPTNNTKQVSAISSEEINPLNPQPVGTGKLKESRAYKRVRDRLEEESKLDVNYNPLNLEKDAENSMNYIVENPDSALRVAFGLQEPPAGMTETAISIALADKAGTDGNFRLQSQLEASRSLRQTRRGQEVVSERGRFDDDSPYKYIQEVMDRRLKSIGNQFKENVLDKARVLTQTQQKLSSTKAKAIRKIDQETAKLKEVLKKNSVKINKAQKIIDALRC